MDAAGKSDVFCSCPAQGFTFGKAGEILTKRLRYLVFKAMLRQVGGLGLNREVRLSTSAFCVAHSAPAWAIPLAHLQDEARGTCLVGCR